MTNDTDERAARAGHTFLPRRSRADRKVAGVAGGLGRAFGVDPVLFRVAFVVLAVFGGSGVLLYCVGWLLMAADGDEVSAVEALAGRGRSSVSTALTVVLIIVAVSSAGSVFSWGLPFWPVVIAAIVVFALVRVGGRGPCQHGRSGSDGDADAAAAFRLQGDDDAAVRGPDNHDGTVGDPARGGSAGPAVAGGDDDPDWGRRAEQFADRVAAWGARAGEWTERVAGGRGERLAGSAAAPSASAAAATGSADAPQQTGPAAAEPAPPEGSSSQPPTPEGLLSQGRTPPSWDPLGAAPFAWDLPDPAPEPEPVAARPARGGRAVARLFLGLALLAGALAAGGTVAGWWTPSWAAIAGIMLALVGAGLLISSLRGSGGHSLIGPGIVLSVATLALTVTGISGTDGYGQHTWTPNTVAQVQDSYVWNGGQATLDLSGLQIPKGEVVATDLTVRGGQAEIIVPAGLRVDATCSATVGDVRCLGNAQSGVHPQADGHQDGDVESGTLKVEVRSNAGQATVRSNG